MPRRKPASAKQRKAELQVKRAIKRGDAPPETASAGSRQFRVSTSTGRSGIPQRGKQLGRANVDASRRLESSFVKFSPEFLEEAKRKASSLILPRPIAPEKLLYPVQYDNAVATDSNLSEKLTAPRRPKWRYDMSKKEVESNEAGQFKRWLAETDLIIQTWKADTSAQDNAERSCRTAGTEDLNHDVETNNDVCDRMPYAPPLFERNLEVWRQLWRVVEICQVLMVLLDARCPPLHYPASLDAYLSSFRPPRKIIFVLTKSDIVGPEISSLWRNYLRKTYPSIRVVTVESYLEKTKAGGQGKRVIKEPHIPADLRKELVQALKEVHNELCSPPPHISTDAGKLAKWKPVVLPVINWDAVLNATDDDISYDQPTRPSEADLGDFPDAEVDKVEEYLSVGLIGQPNVGKSSLLNALFGSHKVKASKTPGKTKHFQTLFWSKQVRLVDCPGLVFPSFVNLEMQVLAGILPISQIPAIPSSIYFALQHLPLEKILMLQHPMEKEKAVEDKRTWRGGRQPNAKRDTLDQAWTAMDVLTAFAEKKGWITAKAGRPDVNRAGNYVLRSLAEGRIKWAFYPPDIDMKTLAEKEKGLGIWIEGEPDGFIAEYASSDCVDDSDRSFTDSEEEGDSAEEDEEEYESSESHFRPGFMSQTGMFGALTLEDGADSA